MTIKQSLVALFLVGFVTYLPSFGNPFIWDDEQFITENRFVQEFSLAKIFSTNTTAGAGLVDNYYRPLTSLSFAFDFQFYQLTPAGWHLTNTLLHSVAGVLLFLYLLTLGMKRRWAFWLSLIFLVHPLQVVSVVYINSRGDPLYAFWVLLGLLNFSLTFLINLPSLKLYNLELVPTKNVALIISVIAFVCAVLSKEIALAALALFFLTGLLHWQKLRPISLRKLSPQILALTIMVLLTIGYLGLRATSLNFSDTFNQVVGNESYQQHLSVRMMTFTRALSDYERLMILPVPLHMERTIPVIESATSPHLWGQLLGWLTVGLLGWLEFKTKKTWWIWFGSLWYLALLVPVSGIIPVNALIYEHWLFLPKVGFFLMLFGVINLTWHYLQTKFDWQGPSSNLVNWILVVLATFWIVLSFYQIYLWADQVRFYEYTLKFNNTARLRNNLGMAYAERGRFEQAITNYQQAGQLSNTYAHPFHNLGNLYFQQREYEQAITAFEKALEINPSFAYSYGSLMQAYLELDQLEKAEQLLKLAQEHYPTDPQLAIGLKLLIDRDVTDQARMEEENGR